METTAPHEGIVMHSEDALPSERIAPVMSLLRFRVTQNIISTVFVCYGGALILIGIAGGFWLLGRHPVQIAAGWSVPFGATGNFTTFGFVILALLGIEVPLNMGAEITNERAITRYLL